MTPGEAARAGADREFLIGLSRAFGGAVFFSLPLLMTMEMWQFGFYLDRVRIGLLLVLILPLLIVLARFSGFMLTSSWLEDVVDGVIALGVGVAAAATIMLTLDLLGPGMSLREITGKIALQAVPGSFGAVLANSQFSADRAEQRHEKALRRRAGYPAQLLFMAVGAVFLAFNIAPTEEIVLLSARLGPAHAFSVLLLTLILMHAFVFGSRFRGMPERPEGMSGISLFLRYTLVGYAIALLVSGYVLWTFGTLGPQSGGNGAVGLVVLGLPAGLGTAAARLVL
ncbi:MAG TPA: TIGR02587 family membrane protein [Longimicrobiales bacterium]|nr:TIGR02587 family membrane protein [Longimicrobiales bacterium]